MFERIFREPTSFGCKTRSETIGHEKAGEVVSPLFNQPDFPNLSKQKLRPPIFVARICMLEVGTRKWTDIWRVRGKNELYGNWKRSWKLQIFKIRRHWIGTRTVPRTGWKRWNTKPKYSIDDEIPGSQERFSKNEKYSCHDR